MKRNKMFAACLAVLVLALAGPASAVEVPEKAVGDDTAMMIWLDVEQVSPEMIKMLGKGIEDLAGNELLEDQGIGLPLGDITEMVKQVTTFREGFIKAGGKGVLLSMGMPDDANGWSPPFRMLAQSGEKMDGDAMSKLISDMSEGEMNAKVTPIADGWHGVMLTDADGEAVTSEMPKPSKDVHASFAKSLGMVKRPVIGFSFRMQESMRKELAKMAQPPAEGEAPADPMVAMMGGMLQPLTALDTIGVAYSYSKETKNTVDIQMVFHDKNNAQQFLQIYNLVLQLAPAMLAPQLQDIPGAPDVAEVTNMFLKLQMKGNGDTLSISLDQAFFDMAEKLIEKLEEAAPGDDELKA